MQLQVQELSKEFQQKPVLNGINYTFKDNCIYALLGRNGAGKTTFFNCLSSDVIATTMQLYFEKNGVIKEVLNPSDVGYVVSTPVVPEFLTGREFLKFILQIHHLDASDAVVNKHFDYLQIEECNRDILMMKYSHGMKSKVQLLANLITSPSILLLDEPLTAFDVVVAEEIKKLLQSIKREHIIIFSTHIMELAMDLCDVILILHEGYIREVDIRGMDREAQKETIIELLKEHTK